MKIGTKSVLYGAHCFFLHPWFVAAAWWKLYGFPWDPRLWVSFFVHDLRYIGKPNMDGEEGELHPFLGARIMGWLFDTHLWKSIWFANTVGRMLDKAFGEAPPGTIAPGTTLTWYCFSLYHSRFLAKKYGSNPTRLCVADKLALCLTPRWLYLPMVRATGEIREYRKLAAEGKYASMKTARAGDREWFDAMVAYLRRWVDEHKDGKLDTWTPGGREAKDETGVWR
jgi:hypothetical protein